MRPGYAAAFVAVLLLVVGGMDRDDAVMAEASRHDVASIAGKAVPDLAGTMPQDDAPPRVRFSIPLGFKATVCQPECVFYYGKRK